MTRVAAALSLLLLSASASAAPEPRALFGEGQYNAAAASYERAWVDKRNPTDGLNAVVAWRTAGRYSHALALLERVRKETPLPAKLEERAKLIETRLRGLTGSIVVSGSRIAGAVIRIDAGEPERSGETLTVNAGKRELTADRDGCDTFRWSGTVLPGQRVDVAIEFVCHAPPTSVHVSLSGAMGAYVRIDERWHKVSEYDLDVEVPRGRHEVELFRGGISVDRRFVDTSPGPARLDVYLPARTKSVGLVLAASSLALGARGGPLAATGVMFGYSANVSTKATIEKFIDRSIGMMLLVHLGYGSLAVADQRAGGFWIGLNAGFHHVLPHLFAKRAGSFLFVLDVEPGLFQFGGVVNRADDRAISYVRSNTYLGFTPIVLSADSGAFHGELSLYPAGFVTRSDSLGTLVQYSNERSYAFAMTLTAGTNVLGN